MSLPVALEFLIKEVETTSASSSAAKLSRKEFNRITSDLVKEQIQNSVKDNINEESRVNRLNEIFKAERTEELKTNEAYRMINNKFYADHQDILKGSDPEKRDQLIMDVYGVETMEEVWQEYIRNNKSDVEDTIKIAKDVQNRESIDSENDSQVHEKYPMGEKTWKTIIKSSKLWNENSAQISNAIINPKRFMAQAQMRDRTGKFAGGINPEAQRIMKAVKTLKDVAAKEPQGKESLAKLANKMAKSEAKSLSPKSAKAARIVNKQIKKMGK